MWLRGLGKMRLGRLRRLVMLIWWMWLRRRMNLGGLGLDGLRQLVRRHGLRRLGRLSCLTGLKRSRLGGRQSLMRMGRLPRR